MSCCYPWRCGRFANQQHSDVKSRRSKIVMDYAAFIPVVLNSSDGEEHSRGQGEEEGSDVARGDGKAGPLHNLTKVVGGRDVLEEASPRDGVSLLTGWNAFR